MTPTPVTYGAPMMVGTINTMTTQHPPPRAAKSSHMSGDKWYLVYVIFVGLGFGCFACWKIFLMNFDYFKVRYPDFRFQFAFAIAFWTPAMPTLLYMNKRGYKHSFHWRIIPALTISALTCFAIPLIDHLTSSTRQPIDDSGDDQPKKSEIPLDLYLTLSCVFLDGICSGVLFSSSFGLAAYFPSIYTQAVMLGNGAAGLLMMLLKLATKLALPSDDKGIREAAYIYFCLGGGLNAAALLLYVFIDRCSFAKMWLNGMRLGKPLKDQVQERRREEPEDATALQEEGEYAAPLHSLEEPLLGSGGGDGVAGKSSSGDLVSATTYSGPDRISSTQSVVSVHSGSKDNQDEPGAKKAGQDSTPVSWAALTRKIWRSMLLVMLNSVVLSALWPGMITAINSVNPALEEDSWFQLINVCMFTIGDYLGRAVAGIPFLRGLFPASRSSRLFYMLLFRCGFFLFFAFCIQPHYIRNDGLIFTGVFVFGALNGFIGSLGMMHGTGSVTEKERSLAGTIMSTCLTGGMFLGSFLAIGVLYAVTGNGLDSKE